MTWAESQTAANIKRWYY